MFKKSEIAMNNILLIQFAGLLHLGLIAAGALMPRTVGLRKHIATLPEFIRKLFWVYYAFIGLCLVSFGALSFFMAEDLATGEPLARAVCAFLAVFWTVRLVTAVFVFDLRPYLTTTLRKVGYQATNVAFGMLPLLYIYVAWKGGEA